MLLVAVDLLRGLWEGRGKWKAGAEEREGTLHVGRPKRAGGSGSHEAVRCNVSSEISFGRFSKTNSGQCIGKICLYRPARYTGPEIITCYGLRETG